MEALPQLPPTAPPPASGGLLTAAPAAAGARRGQWKVLSRGRPEIKPGHVVTFVPPPGESTIEPGLGKALLGSFATFGDDGTPPRAGTSTRSGTR